MMMMNHTTTSSARTEPSRERRKARRFFLSSAPGQAGAVAIILLSAALTGACGDEGGGAERLGDATRPEGATGVTQGGAQDIALLRAIVADGGVPSPETLDPVGFFAEHAVDLPPADCGAPVCVHPILAVAPRFDGGNWTTAFVGLSSPLPPGGDRRSVHAVVAIERSEAVTGALRGSEDNGVRALAQGLDPADRISIVAVGPDPLVVVDAVPASQLVADPGLVGDALDRMAPGQVDLVAGLNAAAEQALRRIDGFDGEPRVVLVTTGVASRGLTAPERILELGESLARQGLGLSVVGVTGGAGATLAAALGDVGAGTYAHAADGRDFVRIMRR
ncbi:MAG TPA: hypothetical protein RMF84_15560, partial [Polyangiaceae bacterium LLY-WYZ-14_1]|nr:hypothetical protein [Polyangiaceae bacterium LLY-WYZ-14_1]